MKSAKRENFIDRILQFLEIRSNQIYKSRELAKQLRIPNRYYSDFKKIVRQLAEEDRISRHKGNKYGKIRKPVEVTGVLHVKTQGYGFINRDDGGEDVFVRQKHMGNAFHRDRVKGVLGVQPKGLLPEGRIVEVLKRHFTRIVGTFQEARTYNYVIPDELRINRDIYIHEANRGGAIAGQKVVVEISKWGYGGKMPEGRVIEVLGRSGEKDVDILSVIHAFDLPLRFPKSASDEANCSQPNIPDSTIENRIDLRERLVFTIDPEDAKDFDDAISLETLSNGNNLLGVHIADVSYFVPVSSATDREALKRGTSVYLVDRVIPMLPDRLSHDICSLRPDEDRLTYSVLMEINNEGLLVDYQIRESIIRSRYRLTYRDAQALLNTLNGKDQSVAGNRESEDLTDLPRDEKDILTQTLREMADLSRIFIRRWQISGSIDFDCPEAEVVLDPKGRPIRLGVRERLDSHRMVEAFMLMANRTVAKHVSQLRQQTGRRYPFIYRIHDRPEGKKLVEFGHFIRALGHKFDVGKRITPKHFQSLLRGVEEKNHEVIVKDVALRTMMKAVYSTRNVGHFGLAFKNYTHFTSPIRRYPDLTVHRLLKAYSLEGHESVPLPVKLLEICEITSEREIIAQEAERESIKAKQMEYMEDRVGEEFDVIISGVTSFGIFVEIPEYLVEGLVHIKDMNDDYYDFDETHYFLKGREGGKLFRLGDSVRVRLVKVWLDMRKMDFNLVED